MTKSVLIVGAGVMGLSTAMYLAETGDYNITVIDAYPVPSKWSAANDYNKIIRCEYADFIYTKLSVEAVKLWRSEPIYKGIYNECGRILITPKSHQGRKEFEAISIENLKKIPGEGLKFEYYQGGDDLRNKFEFLSHNTVDADTEWKWNPEAGLAHSANAMVAVKEKAEKLGVKFIFGEAGWAKKLEKVGNVEYIVTQDGSRYTADQILISAGAATGYIVDLKQQQSATGLFVTHIQLTPSEYEKHKNMPVVFDAEMGYFFPPDPETHILKIALPGSGASNMVTDPHDPTKKSSLPRFKVDNPSDTMPSISVEQSRNLLNKYVPELAYHDLFDSKACWIADTADSHLIVDKIPGSDKVFVATGDSGHLFKLLPNIGKYVKDKLEGSLAEELSGPWKWRDELEEFDPTACNWRVVSEPLDMADVDFIDEQVENRRSKL